MNLTHGPLGLLRSRPTQLPPEIERWLRECAVDADASTLRVLQFNRTYFELLADHTACRRQYLFVRSAVTLFDLLSCLLVFAAAWQLLKHGGAGEVSPPSGPA